MSAPGEWFREWFGEEYLALYPHRDAREAEVAVRLFRRAADPRPDAPVLDLACGAGRHLGILADLGFRPVGIDLSRELLAEARRRENEELPLVRGDMRRLPFVDAAFGAVASFFTSFGYFASSEEDRRVAAEMRRVLRPGGVFLLDYLNAPRVRAALVPRDERRVKGRTVRQERWLEGESVVKRIEIRPAEGEPEVHYERVRLYGPDELERLLARHGLRTEARFGDYDGSPYGETSPRVILVGRRP